VYNQSYDIANTVSTTPEIESETLTEYPLGQAKAQIFGAYILSQTADAFYLVDQHAAAERLLYEEFKTHFDHAGVEQQLLLLPEIMDIKESERQLLSDHKGALEKLGITFDFFGATQIMIKAIPAKLADTSPRQLVQDIVSDLMEEQPPASLIEKLLEKLASKACHGSVRSGRILSVMEMNALLRSMECTSNVSQCNHGRPTLIKLTKGDLEKLFERA
jgi:DNA mismatch repair protein MutL